MKKSIIQLLLFFAFLELSLQSLSLIAKSVSHFSKQTLEVVSKNNKKQFHILCLGESTTAWGGNYSYPAILERLLNEKAGSNSFQVANEGMVSKNSSDILLKTSELLASTHPDLAILMVGINDYWSLPNETPTRFDKVIQFLGTYLKSIRLVQLAKVNLEAGYYKSDPSKQEKVSQCPPPYWSDSKHEFNEELGRQAVHTQLTRPKQNIKWFTHNIHKFKSIFLAHEYERNIIAQFGLLHTNSDVDSAIEILCEAGLKYSPEDFECRQLLASAKSVLGHPEQAKPIFEGLVSENSTSSETYLDLGKIYADSGLMNKAIETYERGIRILNKNGYCDLAFYLQDQELNLEYYKMKDSNLALSTLEQILKSDLTPGRRAQFINRKIQFYGFLGKQIDELPRPSALNYWENLAYQKNINEIIGEFQRAHIPVLVMQYPRLPIAPVERIIINKERVRFVENSSNFELYLATHKFEDAFADSFADRFGHFTKEGAQLVSENVLNYVLKLDE